MDLYTYVHMYNVHITYICVYTALAGCLAAAPPLYASLYSN